jgi:hypothetical protein
MVVRFLQVQGVSEQVIECLGPERFQQKGSVCVVQQV